MQKYNALNYPLFAGDGDAELVEAVEDALYAIHDFEPDVLLVAAGAGGYTPLTYTPVIWSEVVHTIHRELKN